MFKLSSKQIKSNGPDCVFLRTGCYSHAENQGNDKNFIAIW